MCVSSKNFGPKFPKSIMLVVFFGSVYEAEKNEKRIKNFLSCIEKSLRLITMGLLHYIMTRHYWVVGTLMVPVALIFDVCMKALGIINFFTKLLTKSTLNHEQKVKDVQNQVKEWIASGSKKKMCTARPVWKSITIQKVTYKERMWQINVDMEDILLIDTENMFVRVEPSCTIGKLNDELMKQGWMAAVVPELDELTIGGLIMGCGLETTSVKYGLFNHICSGLEMVMADGSVEWVTPETHPELTLAIMASYGTLGFLTAVDVAIVPYKPYIEMTYRSSYTLDDLTKELEDACKDPDVDSVEGIMYSLDRGVMMSGKFVDSIPRSGVKNSIGRWYKPWFYKHVESILDSSSDVTVEYIPTKDFYHRHNKGCFWLTGLTVPFGNHPVYRWLFGWTLPPRFELLKYLRHSVVPVEEMTTFVCQDYLIKLDDFKKSIRYFHDQCRVMPVWLCPCLGKVDERTKDYLVIKEEEMYIDVGLYGWVEIFGRVDCHL